MRKTLLAVTLAIAMIMMLSGCYSEEAPVNTITPTEKQIVPTETSSIIENEKTVAEKVKPEQVKKPETDAVKPVETKEQKAEVIKPTEAPKPEVKTTKPTEAKKTETTTAKPAETQMIGRDKAVTTALSNAGVAKNNVRDLDVELEKERGMTFYEVSFDVGNMEYEYDIDAYTGKILFSKAERDN